MHDTGGREVAALRGRAAARPRLLALLTALLAAVAPGPSGARVVLLGLDGASWNVIDPALAAGELPQLAALAARGVTGDLATVEPVTSPAVWTSIATGRSPEAHGVTGFYATRAAVRTPTAFERLAVRGHRVGLYDYLVTWPAPRLPGGFAIPGWLRRSPVTFPPDVFARAGIEPYVWSALRLRTPEDVLHEAHRELREKPERLGPLLTAYDLDVAAMSLYALDVTSHRFWKDAHPEEFSEAGGAPADPARRTAIAEMVRAADGAVGAVAGALGPEDVLLIVSDHGFRAAAEGVRTWRLDAQTWLLRAGLRAERDRFEIRGGFENATVRVLPGAFDEREALTKRIEAAFAGARTPDGEPVVRVDRLDGAERPPHARRGFGERLRQIALRGVAWWADLDLDDPAHAWIFVNLRTEVLPGAWPDARVAVGDRRIPVSRLVSLFEMSGDHAPVGVFVAAGPPIAHRAGRVALSALDVAPLLFYLAGEPVPDDLEGAVPEAILRPEHLAAHPIRRVAAAEMPGLDALPAEADDDDADIRERLRTLGYER